MAFHKAKALQEAEKSVSQGKIAQAIKQYQIILDNEPSDLSLLNTIGDLYIRDRNITEGLRQFHRLAEAYVREGFNVKAIAIYRKITKVDPNSIETLLKLADLYQQQGLSREAREQYLQVADFFRKRNQMDKVLEVLHKLVQTDPENLNFRNRLAMELERIGKLAEAAAIYLESAEITVRHGDQAGAEALLSKAAELDPKNSKVQLLRARMAVAHHRPEEAESIINSSPELRGDPVGKRLLLDAYITLRKIPEAASLVIDVLEANPSDLAPVSTVSWLLAETGEVDQAFRLVETVSLSQVGANQSGTLLDILHQIRSKAPNHVPTLELMLHICQRSADGLMLLDVLGALGRAYEQAGNLEKAESTYQKMVEREPDDERILNLLNDVRKKLGKEITSVDFSTIPLPMQEEEEDLPSDPHAVDANQESTVKEALENSDLFSRYNLTEKAIAELDKVLQAYPDQIEVHRRILEISRKGFPDRGASAALQLARIFRSHGDEDLAAKYDAIAQGSIQEIPPMPQSSVPLPGPVSTVSGEPTPESSAPSEFPISALQVEETAGASTPPPGEIRLDVSPWEVSAGESAPVAAPPSAPTDPLMEMDLSADLEALANMIPEDPVVEMADPESVTGSELASQDAEEFTIHADSLTPAFHESPQPEVMVPAKAAPEIDSAVDAKPAPSELEDGKVEVEFYLENDFLDEARQTITKLEDKFPGNPLVAELQRKVDDRGTPSSAPAPTAQEEVQAPPHPDIAPPAILAADVPAPDALAEPAQEPLPEPVVASPEPVSPQANESPAVEIPAAAPGGDLLGDLVGDLDASLAGFAPPLAPLRAPVSPSHAPLVESPIAEAPPVVAAPPFVLSQLSGLLAEMDEPLVLAHNQDDPETHYSLGVAFREMGLLDESIGEFQKVVRGARKGNYPSNFLQACTLLAICFMEKKMPALAIRWYKRALETPDLDEEALLALQYDMGVAFEQAGDARNALDRFTEVYSQNIDFRDVAEKIRELQQKV